MSATEQPPYRPFALSIAPNPREVAVIAIGELDVSSADTLERTIRKLRDSEVEHVVLDLRQVGFMDSTGLRVLLSLRNDARRNGHTLTLVPGPPNVERIFALTATRGLFDWRRH